MTLQLSNEAIQASPASFRDPAGFVFKQNHSIYRKINPVGFDHYDYLMQSGLYDCLVKKNLLIPHQEIRRNADEIIIQPELIPYISYPYEWCFSQIKDAALATLEIQNIAVDYGMTLKDASAYNIQYLRCRPIFIDTLSFEKRQDGDSWAGYKQFCQHFLGPLALMAYTDVRLQKMLTSFIDGIPLELVASLLPARSKLSFGLYIHLHLHAKFQKKFENSQKNQVRKKVTTFQLKALIDSLKSNVLKIKNRKVDSEWAEYYTFTNYGENSSAHKAEIISSYLDLIHPNSLVDVGGNDGSMTRIATAKKITSIACDIDHAAVEKNYLLSKRTNDVYMLPLVQDLVNPSPYIGWHHQERDSFLSRIKADCVLALALIHHLAISNNLPLEKIAEYFAEMTHHLIIEFVPKSDSKVAILLTTRNDIFPGYTQENFESIFSRFFQIMKRTAIKDSDRTLYWMQKKS